MAGLNHKKRAANNPGNTPAKCGAWPASTPRLARFAAYFHELDAWTEYWDLYHPETRGRYYFGHESDPGLLDLIVPRSHPTAIFDAWNRRALGIGASDEFAIAVPSAIATMQPFLR